MVTATKIDVSAYGIDDSEFVTNKKGFAHCQSFNPQSGNHGLAINQEIAKAINFKPDRNWALENVTLKGDDKKKFTGQMWFSRSPRMIILNGYQDALISNEIKVASAPLLMKEKETKKVSYYKKEEFDATKHENFYRVLVMLFVDKDNNLLSEEPLVFRTRGKAQSLIGDIYTEYVKDSIKQFEKITGKVLPKQTPTCKFTSRFIFCPTLEEGELFNKDNSVSSEATIISKYEKITEDNFSSLVLPNDHPTLIHAHSLLPQLKSMTHPAIDQDGVVNRLSAEDIAALNEMGVEF